MNPMNSDYLPISRSEYDILEVAAIKNKRLILTDAEGTTGNLRSWCLRKWERGIPRRC